MTERTVRVNELIKREINHILRTHYREEAVAITITRIEIAPDLRFAKVFYTVIGDTQMEREATRFLSRSNKRIRHALSKVIILKSLPHLRFIRDLGSEASVEMIDMMQQIEDEDQHP